VGLRTHVCVVSYFRLLSFCVLAFHAFERAFCPPSCACLSICCQLMCCLRAGFRLFICVCAVLVRTCVCSRELHTHLFVILGTVCMRIGVFGYQFARILRWIRVYFIDLVSTLGRMDICSFWYTFDYDSKSLLSPLSFERFIPSGTFYASTI
jgi:hypothetical protein